MAFQAESVFVQAPHTIGYFNEAAGGPFEGWRHLSGSNVDYGQDLWWLRQWLQAHENHRPLYLACYGNRSPWFWNVPSPPRGFGDSGFPVGRPHQDLFGPLPGRYAVSVLFQQRLVSVPGEEMESAPATRPPSLFGYLKHFRPTAIVGTTIWIYDISFEDANRVRRLYGLAELGGEEVRR
jgi:hypothetical protein